ncbi:MAG: hypothetical protein KAJ42_08845 [Gemmatimonadetes bacterium]|nr:hypothetical protein [Gemmatimonadota bacterium]
MTFRPSVLPTRDNTIIDTFTRTFNATQRAIAMDQANKRADREFAAKREDQDLRNEAALLATNLEIASNPALSRTNAFGIDRPGTTATVTAETPGVGGGRTQIAEAVGPTLQADQPGVDVGVGPGGDPIFFSLEAQRQEVERAAIAQEDLEFRLGEREREMEATELAEGVERRSNALATIGRDPDVSAPLTPAELAQAAQSETATNAALAADRAAVVRANTPSAETEGGLRAEFNASPIFKDALSIAGSYSSLLEVLAIPSSGPNDLSVIFSFMKMLDPGSVVREGEFANAANSQGWSDRARALYNRIARGERLAAPARAEFERSARALIRGRRRLLNGHIAQFSRFAGDQDVDARNVVTDPYAFAEGLVGEEGDENLDPGAGGAAAFGRIGDAGVGEGRWAGSGGVAIERAGAPAPAAGAGGGGGGQPPAEDAPVGTGSVLLPERGVDLPDTAIDAETGQDLGDGLSNAERALELQREGNDPQEVLRIMRAEGRIS